MSFRAATLLVAVLVTVPAGFLAFATPAAAAEPTATNVTIVSFDGTKLAATLFLPATADEAPVPFLLMTHGWAGSRATTLTGRVAAFVDAGYGVLTWDSRGFGQSGGEVMLNSVNYEVRDVQSIITWLELNAPVKMVGGDPLIGMSGVSYAGGIQLLSVAFDERIDAIAPEITWNDLVSSLAPNGVPKLAWTSLLFGGGAATSCSAGHEVTLTTVRGGCQTSALARYYALVHGTNGVPDEVREALTERSPKTYMDSIDVPTLLVQGFPDTLFDVDQAVANYQGIKANGAPVKLWLYDGGHELQWASNVPDTQASLVTPLVIRWMDRYVKGLTTVDTGPEVEYFTSGGAWLSASEWPLAQTARTVHVNGVPPLLAGPFPTGSFGSTTLPLLSGKVGKTVVATGGANVTFEATTATTEAFLFFGLGIRDAAGTVTRLGDQVAPVRIAEGGSAYYTVDLVDVSASLRPTDTLVLTLSTMEPHYDAARTATFVYVTDVDVVVKALEV